MNVLRALSFVALAWGLLQTDAAVAQSTPARVAVVVGANAAGPGRRPLRYAHTDAREVAQVLVDVAGYAAADVHLLLDPEPAALLATLDRALQSLSHAETPSTLLFYYSGHADERALFPHGDTLSLRDLQHRLEDPRVDVRLGILDACRGGGWTGARGLSETEIFEIELPMTLTSEGSVLIAASSGLEDAHESEQIEGGFFTHHWNAALRGAGDQNGDRTVSLLEALEYSRERTVRDTALRTEVPQHPSFRINLRGRQDLPLTRPGLAATVLTLEQDAGPLQLVQLERGVVVLETPPGRRTVRLSVPAGRYVVRSSAVSGRRATSVDVVPGVHTSVREAELEATDTQSLASRGETGRPIQRTTLRDGGYDLRLAAGVRHGEAAPGMSITDDDKRVALLFQFNWGITDRLQWSIPTLSLAYRFGELGGFEWVPWGGLTSWGIGGSSLEGLVITGDIGLGMDLRWWFGRHQSLIATVSLGSEFYWHSKEVTSDSPYPDGSTNGREAPTSWRGRLTLGYSYTLADTVTLNFAVGYAQALLQDGALPEGRVTREQAVQVGSIQSLAFRSRPLVRVHISDFFSLDAYAGVRYDLAQKLWQETYMAGFAIVW